MNTIILNRMYAGSYLDENIGHEVINLFKDNVSSTGTYNNLLNGGNEPNFLLKRMRNYRY